MKPYYKLKIFWVAWFEVKFNQILGMPEFEYAWWKARLDRIKKGKIKKGE